MKGKFSYQLDYQYRRQGNSEKLHNQFVSSGQAANEGPSNLFAHPYQQVVRPWIGYQINPNVKFSLSPIGWWGTWTPTANSGLNFQPEFRITSQLIINQTFGRVTLTQRYRYEFRFFGQTLPTDSSASPYTNLTSYDTRKSRARYMVRAIIPINNTKIEKGTAYLNVYNEVFIGIGHNTKPERIFDQNRTFLGLGYKFTPQLRIEAGYLNQFVPRGTPAGIREMDMNSVLQMFVILEDFNSFFKKKGE